jgi:Tol biopolymer transport system component
MTTHEPSFSLADLAAAGIVVTYVEAVSIVQGLVLRASRGELPGVPSAQVIRLSRSGAVFVEGPIAADGSGAARAALLLEALLPGFDAPAELRVPGALRLVLARALGTLDLPAYPSLETFAQALSRFASADPEAAIRDLAGRVAIAGQSPAGKPDGNGSSSEPVRQLSHPAADRRRLEARSEGALTVSDIRRARRATGMTLAQISERSDIPARLLRELEWGYLHNWPAAHLGRTHLIRYARAAGIDELNVVRTVGPLLRESVRERAALDRLARALPSTTDSGSEGDVVRPLELETVRPFPMRGPQRWRRRYLAALAIPALLAVGVAPALWDRSARSSPASATTAQDAATVQRPPAAGGTGADVLLSTPDGVASSPSFASAGTPVFYPADGSRAALADGDPRARGSILRITSVVDTRAQTFHARQSPDGSRIAFDSDRDGERGVYVADADGHNVRRVSGNGFAALPSWSPDGRTLAFVRAESGRPDVWNLWTADLSTGRTRRLTSHEEGQPWGGSWLPDGRRMAYSRGDQLVVMELETGRQRAYGSPVAGRSVRMPAVSPDGMRVMFQVQDDGTWLLDFANGAKRKVLSDQSAEEYTWSSDGRRVAYYSRNAGAWGIWVVASR